MNPAETYSFKRAQKVFARARKVPYQKDGLRFEVEAAYYKGKTDGLRDILEMLSHDEITDFEVLVGQLQFDYITAQNLGTKYFKGAAKVTLEDVFLPRGDDEANSKTSC